MSPLRCDNAMPTTDEPVRLAEPDSFAVALSRWWLVAAVAVAFLLRIHCLIHPYLWLDEYVTLWSIGGGGYADMLDRSLQWTASGPLFVLIYRVSCDLVGNVDWGLKIPGVVFGVLSVPAAWWAARRLFRHRYVAVGSAWLVALAPQFIHFSQEARPYMAGSLVNILAIGCLATWFRNGTRRHLVATVALSLAGVGIHLLAVLAIAAQNAFVLLYGLVQRRQRLFWMEWMAAQLVLAVGLCLVGVQFYALRGRHDSMIVNTRLPMPTRLSLDQGVWGQFQSEVTIAVVGLGIGWLARRMPVLPVSQAWHQDGAETVLCGLSYIVPTSLLTMLSVLRVVDCWPRYYFLFHGGLLLAITWLVVRAFPKHIACGLAALATAGLISQFNMIEGIPSCRLNGIWIDFSKAGQELRRRIGPGDLVLSRSGLVEANDARFLRDPVGASYLKAFLEAKDGPLPATHFPLPFSPESSTATAYLSELFHQHVQNRNDFWLVNLGTPDFDYNDWVRKVLGSRCSISETIHFPALTIYRYTLENPSELATVVP